MPTIYESDLVLLESERLTDTDDGGGLATVRVVEDGQSGQVFPGLSRMDATVGRLWLRKLFVGVQSENADSAYGMFIFIAKKPDNESVDIILFEASAFSDTQTDIRAAVAGYLDQGARTSMFLYGLHRAGQKTLTAIRNKSDAAPGIGEVLYLLDGANKEFVRIENLSESTLTFENDKGSFTVNQVVLTLTEPLTQNFSGVTALTRISQGSGTVIYDSAVNDAARYYGILTQTEAALLPADFSDGQFESLVYEHP